MQFVRRAYELWQPSFALELRGCTVVVARYLLRRGIFFLPRGGFSREPGSPDVLEWSTELVRLVGR